MEIGRDEYLPNRGERNAPCTVLLARQGAFSLGNILPRKSPVCFRGTILMGELTCAIWHESAMRERFKRVVARQLVLRRGAPTQLHEDKAPTL